MLCSTLLLIVVLSSVKALTAPVMEAESSAREVLKNALINDTEHLEKIKAAFTLEPDEVKLCIQVQYNVFESNDGPTCAAANFNRHC